MTYHPISTAIARRSRPRKRATATLGIWPFDQISEWVTGGDPLDCLNDANAKTAPLDATINDMAKNWNPSGFYSPEQVLAAYAQAMLVEKSAREHLDGAPRATGDADTVIAQARDRLDQAGAKALDFITAANTAKNQGIKIVDAPGLKRWVLNTMSAASNAHTTAYVQECAMSGLASAIIAYQQVFDKAAGVFKQIVGVVVAAGDAVLHLPDTIADIYPYVKWGLLAGAAIWAFYEIRKRA